MDQADIVFDSLLGPDGHVTRESFRAFFHAQVAPPVAPMEPAVVAVEQAPMLDLVATEPSPAVARQKKRALSVEEEEEWEVDADSDSFALSPAEKKPKSKKAAPAPKSSGGKKKLAPIFGGAGASVTKAVRTARLKAVVASLKQGVKAKKFYNSAYAAFGPRVVACNAELSIVPDEFEAIFGASDFLLETGGCRARLSDFVHRFLFFFFPRV
jgi:hypothetical protein